jgi:hypothetical protein
MSVRTPISKLFKIIYCKSLYMRRLDAFHNKVRARPFMGRDLNDRIPDTASAASSLQMCKIPFFFKKKQNADKNFYVRSRKSEKRPLASYRLPVRPSVHAHGTTRLPPDGLPWNLIIEDFFENPFRKFKFYSSLSKIMSTLHEDSCTFMIPPRFLPKINDSDKICKENQNSFLFNLFFSPKILPFIR